MSYILKIAETKSEGLEREFLVTLDGNFIEEKIEEALKKKAEKTTISGFRPGKAPVAMIRQRYLGDVMEDILNKLVEDSTQKVLSEKKTRPAGSPHYHFDEQYESGKDFSYRVHFEMIPDVKPLDDKAVKLTKYLVPLDREKLDEVKEKQAFIRGTDESYPDEHRIQKDNMVNLDMKGTINGTEEASLSYEDLSIQIGQESYLPELHEALMGRKVGDSFSFDATASLKKNDGEKIILNGIIKTVSKRVPAEINDEFAKLFGMDNLQALDKAIEDTLHRQNNELIREAMKHQVLDQLDGLYKMDLPKKIVQAELKNIFNQLKEAGNKADDKSTEKKYKSLAERRVKLGFVLAALAEQYDLKVSPKELEDAVREIAAHHPGKENQVFSFFKSNAHEVQNLYGTILEDKVVDFIIKNAQSSDKTVTKEELEDIIKKTEIKND